MAESSLFFNIFAKDNATGVFDKVARSADKAASSMSKSGKVSAAVEKATLSLTKAHNAESDALDKVEVAESKLSNARQIAKDKTSQARDAETNLLEVRKNTNSTTSQIATAEQKLSSTRATAKNSTTQVIAGEKALSKARRDAAVAGNVAQKAAKDLTKVLDEEGKKAGKGLGASIKKWFTGDGNSIFKQMGNNAGNGFLGAFTGALKTPIIGPAIAVGIGAALAAVLPAVGAAAAGILVVGFGAGLAVLGSVFAAKTTVVKNAWNRTLWAMAADMKIFSKPFESTLVSVAGIATRTFAKFAPSLAENFKEIAPAVTKFADDLGKGFERLQPAIRPLSEAFAAVLGSLGPAMQNALGSVSGSLVRLSESVKANPQGLSDMVQSLGTLTGKLIDVVTWLNNVNAAFDHISGGASVTDIAFGKATSAVGKFLEITFATINPLNNWNSVLGLTANSANKASTAVGLTGNAAQLFTQGLSASQVQAALAAKGLDGVAGAATRSAHETHAANAAALLLAGAYDRQARATQGAIDTLNRMSDLLLGLSGAQIDYQQAIDDTTAAIKANGATHDLNTQKGRDNQRALNTFTQSAKAQRDAMLKAGDGNLSAAKSAEASRGTYVKLATQMGYNKTVAQGMAAEFIKIPAVTKATITANITDLRTKLATAETALKSPHLTATKKAKLEATITNLKAGIATSKALLATLPVSRTAKLQADKKDLEAKIAQAQLQLKNPNLTATKTAKLKADIANAKAGINTINGMLGNLPPSKSITITTTFTEIHKVVGGGSKSSATGAGGGHEVAARAAGGPVTGGVPYLVGENGPEIVVPKDSGVVLPKIPAATTGNSVASGMADGIRSGAAAAISAAGDMANAVISKAREVLGISSPSKAFAQIALYLTQGFSIGIRGSAKSVQSAMASLMSKVLNISFNAADTKASIQKTITSLNNSIAAARKRIKPITSGMSKSEVAATKRNNAAAAASIKALQAKLASARKDLGNVTAIANRLGTTPKRNAVIAMLNRENKEMQAMANKRAAVAVQLKAAQTKLAAAIQLRDDFKKQITDASISFNAITNIQPPEGGQLTAAGIIAGMTETLRKTQQFAANLAKLKAKGLNATVYQQIAEAGADQGGAIADALLAGGPNTFNTLNRLQANINSASAGLGNTAANNLYQAGVNAAQGLVNGLLAKTKALDAASKKLADAIVAQIKKTLGIHSPSSVLMGHGSMAGRGFAMGLEREYGRVMRAGAGLANAATGGVGLNGGVRRRDVPGGTRTGGGGDIYITVTGAVDPISTAKQIQQLLLNLKRTNGRVELGIA